EVVCAGWIAPTDSRSQREREDAERDAAAAATFDRLARGCGCSAAQRVGVIADAPACLGGRRLRTCDPDPALQQAVLSAHGAMVRELADFTPVRNHWRVAGPLGRAGRFEYVLEFETAKLELGTESFGTRGRKPD